MKRKYLLIALLLALAAGLVYAQIGGYAPYDLRGNRTNPGQSYTGQLEWQLLASFASGTTTPDGTHRSATTFTGDAKNAIYLIPINYNKIRLRCASTTDADSSVFDVFMMDGVADHYNRIVTLTFTTGTQAAVAAGDKFADTVTKANDNWVSTITLASTAGNYIAEAVFDTGGAKYLGISPTTITHAAKVYVKGF